MKNQNKGNLKIKKRIWAEISVVSFTNRIQHMEQKVVRIEHMIEKNGYLSQKILNINIFGHKNPRNSGKCEIINLRKLDIE